VCAEIRRSSRHTNQAKLGGKRNWAWSEWLLTACDYGTTHSKCTLICKHVSSTCHYIYAGPSSAVQDGSSWYWHTESTTWKSLSDYQIPRPDHPPPPYVNCSKVGGDRLKSQKSLLIELAIAFNSTSDTGDTWQVVLIKTSTTYSITGQMYTNLSTSIWPFHKNSLELKSSPALIVRSVSNHSQLFAAAVRLVHILTVVVIFYLSNAQCNVENEK
jgi:hypothetical protein